MCSIFGFYRMEPAAPVHPNFLDQARRLMRHRGPDHEQVLELGRATLGHQRLSIVDLSEAARQPMTYADSTISYNGEIYNFPELRAELPGGIPFKSSSDTEVLLHLLRLEDVRCLNRLNGMWAFAHFDATRQRLLLGRDRYGIKPLYYMVQDEVLYFSSEIDPLALHSARMPPQSGCLSRVVGIPGQRSGQTTHLQGISQVRRGHYLEVQPGCIQEHKWYYFRDYPVDARDFRRPGDLSSAPKELLTDALRICLRADVPVGITLSGGLDSRSSTPWQPGGWAARSMPSRWPSVIRIWMNQASRAA